MKLKDNQYYYTRLRSAYAVYLHHEGENGHRCDDKVFDNLSVVEAREKVKELNKQFKK